MGAVQRPGRIAGPAPNPCASCPYRRNVPSGVWSAGEYDKLREYDGEMWAQSPNVFLCHQNSLGERDQLCAGWVGCHGADNLLAIRLSLAAEFLDPEVLDYTTKTPLWPSGRAAGEHGMRDIDDPSEEASEMVEKIMKRRPETRLG